MNIYCIRPKGYNIGNDIIFLAMKHFIYKAFGYMPNLIMLPATSKYDGQRAGLTAKTIYEINQFGDGVIIGGGNLYENNELDIDLNALDKLSVPLFLFSLSRGRVYNKEGFLIERTDVMPDTKIKALHQKAFISTARDIATQKYIGSTLIACPTLFLSKLKLSFPEVEKNLILISIRNPSLMCIPVRKQNEITNCIKALINNYKNIGYVKILCHDFRDIPFAEELSAEYIYTEDALEFLSLLKYCQLNISFRLHSTLPCLSFNKNVINISYDERALSLMDTIGYKRWNINMMGVKKFIDEIELKNRDIDILKKLKQVNQSLWNDFYNKTLELFQTFTKEIT